MKEGGEGARKEKKRWSQWCSCRWEKNGSRLEVDRERGGENEMMREKRNKKEGERLMNGRRRKGRKETMEIKMKGHVNE